jgi:putative SOS response-associated peptidase YedK
MCGKFTQMMSWGELVELSDLIGRSDGPSETVMPMHFATVLARDDKGVRRAVRMRWGLVPPGARDPREGTKHIHARAETIDTKPTFADSFAQRRGLVVVRTFNEGREITPTKTEQHTITPRDGLPIAIAVIWDRWSERNEGMLLSFAMVTTAANKLISTITDRMPAIVQPENWQQWLGEEPASVAELKAMIVPFEGDWTMEPERRTPPPKKPSDHPSLFD